MHLRLSMKRKLGQWTEQNLERVTRSIFSLFLLCVEREKAEYRYDVRNATDEIACPRRDLVIKARACRSLSSISRVVTISIVALQGD